MSIYIIRKCDYCGEENQITRPTPFMADMTAMMCKQCWDMTEKEYKASEGACIGKFEDGPGYEDSGLSPEEVKIIAEKQIPKKPIFEDNCVGIDGETPSGCPVCPNCKEPTYNLEWCSFCGQRLEE